MTGGTPWWDADELTRRRPYLEARTRIVAAVREFFRARDFTEVETPALQFSPGLEPHLRPFAITLEDPLGGAPRVLYLHTSPEYAMKKLLAAGVTRPFQMARVFRNAERSALHQPEFTMLEWYRRDEDYGAIMDDCLALLAACATDFRHVEVRCDATAAPLRITVAEAFDRYAGIDVLGARDLAAEAKRIGVAANANDEWEDAFFKIFLDRIEPHLGVGRPALLTEYPAAMAALARLKPGDARVAERFELYVCGVELANGFGELTDAAEQRARFEADRARRKKIYGTEAPPIDEELLAALPRIGTAAGVALGLDRLVMLATGARRVEDVLWAPVS